MHKVHFCCKHAPCTLLNKQNKTKQMGITKQHKNVQIMALFKRKAREHFKNSFSTEPAQLFVYIHIKKCPNLSIFINQTLETHLIKLIQ